MVVYTLMALMIITSLAAFIWSPLAVYVSGVGELHYVWQPWMAVGFAAVWFWQNGIISG